MFVEERSQLRPLPLEGMRYFRQETRTVDDAGCVQVDGSFYAAGRAPLYSEVLVRVYEAEIEVRDLDGIVLRRHPKSLRKGHYEIPAADRIFNPSRESARPRQGPPDRPAQLFPQRPAARCSASDSSQAKLGGKRLAGFCLPGSRRCRWPPRWPALSPSSCDGWACQSNSMENALRILPDDAHNSGLLRKVVGVDALTEATGALTAGRPRPRPYLLRGAPDPAALDADDMPVDVIIPALNEAGAIRNVVRGVLSQGVRGVYVVDNGSDDGTAEIAAHAGAVVVDEQRRGYGAACLAGLRALPSDAGIVVFIDADGSDDVRALGQLVAPIRDGKADFVVGSRALGFAETGSMTFAQRIGNVIASAWLRGRFGIPATDLGPFRAIRASSLRSLDMADTDYGWTVEMQIKAARAKLRYREVPVSYRRRIGRSKISGTVRGTLGAGVKILSLLARYDLRSRSGG